MPPGATPATKSRFEMLLGAEGTRDAPSRAADAIQRMIGQVPHLTRQMQERMAAIGGRRSSRRSALNYGDEPATSRLTTLKFLRALKRNNRREWFKPRKERVRSARPRSRCSRSSSGWPWTFATFAPDLVVDPKIVDVPHLPRHALLREQDAVQDARRRESFRRRGLPKHEGAGAVLSCVARRSLDWRRYVRAAAAAAAGRPRAHCRERQAAARDRRVARFRRTSAGSKASGCSVCRAGFRRITRRRSI